MRKLAGALSLLGALVPSIAQADGLFADSAMPWTGVYVGAGIGRKWADTEWTTTCFGAACTTGGANPFLPDNSSPRDFATNGLRKTLYAGFNWQLEHWLLGVEGDVGYGSKVKFTPGIPGCTIFCGGLTPTPG
jgi:opacity protein-like surface antigen